MLRKALQALAVFGIDVHRLYRATTQAPGFVRDALAYRRAAKTGPFMLRFSELNPALGDRFEHAGNAYGHYFYQDLWAARRIFARRPPRHIDIGSRIDGFIAHLLVFMNVEVVDIRPLSSSLSGLMFRQGDASHLEHCDDL